MLMEIVVNFSVPAVYVFSHRGIFGAAQTGFSHSPKGKLSKWWMRIENKDINSNSSWMCLIMYQTTIEQAGKKKIFHLPWQQTVANKLYDI